MKPSSTQYKDILEVLDLASLEPQEQEEIMFDLNDLVFKGTLARLIGRMDERTQSEFEELLSTEASEEEVEGFIQKHVPDADTAVTETIAELTNDILAVTR